LEGLAIEDVGVFYGHLAYFTAIWYILWPFGIFYGHLVYFSRFGMLYKEKSGNPALSTEELLKTQLSLIERNVWWKGIVFGVHTHMYLGVLLSTYL
jgi:hypothetical protein